MFNVGSDKLSLACILTQRPSKGFVRHNSVRMFYVYIRALNNAVSQIPKTKHNMLLHAPHVIV